MERQPKGKKPQISQIAQIALTGAFFVLSLCAGALAQEPWRVFPGKSWQARKPADVGLDRAKLDAIAKYLGGRGCITRHGYLVYSWGDCAKAGDVASACKPWYAHFLFKAVEDGRLKSVDVKVADYVPELKQINPLAHRDAGIAFRHCANQTSCYGVSEAPGTAYCYNDWQMALFWDALFLKVYGATYETVDAKVVRPLLTDLLQCEDGPSFMAFGTKNRPGRVKVSPRDFCRFGLLYLNEGNWRGKQLLSREHARRAVSEPLPATLPQSASRKAELIKGQRSIGSNNIPDNQTDHFGSYSWLWWVNGERKTGKRFFPDAPRDVWCCLGHKHGMRGMAVIPALDIVMSWNDTQLDRKPWKDQQNDPHPLNVAFKLLGEAAGANAKQAKKQPRPGQLVVDSERPQWLKRHGGKPLLLCGPGDPEDFLYRGKRRPDGTRDGDQQAIIKAIADSGANCIYFQAVRSHGGDGRRDHNPFNNPADPASGLNEKIFAQWSRWFDALEKGGVAILLFIYDDSVQVWGNKQDAHSPPAEKAFFTALVDRFERHGNIIWCVAEEYGERLSRSRASEIAATIRAADDYHHVIAVHQNDGNDFHFADDLNVEQFAVQFNRDTPEELHAGMVAAWRKAEGRFNLNLSEAAVHRDLIAKGDRAGLRQSSWACAMAGAHVMHLGAWADNGAAPTKAMLEDCGRLVRFFEQTDFQTMAPHDELALGATNYVLANPGKSYIAYSLNAGKPIGLKALPKGTYSLRWLDLKTGATASEKTVEAPGGDFRFTRPANIGAECAVWIYKINPHSAKPTMTDGQSS